MSRLSPSDSWILRAEQALEEMHMAETKAERDEVLRRRARVWSLVKDDLSELSHGKCWYCESRQSRSYMVVDHFRPKGTIKDADPEHEGYWWLAFDLSNYRFACTFCNSPAKDSDDITRGKRNFFPLVDESLRARSSDDDIDLEKP